MTERLNINPVVLKWCREQTGYSISEVVEKINISDTKATSKKEAVSAVQKLEKWENGKDVPSYTVLQKLASFYKRPLLTFFMPNPPVVQNKLVDFRTLDSLPHGKDSPEFAKLKRQIFYLQESLSDLQKNDNASRLDFINSVSVNTNIFQFVQNIRQRLSFSYDEQRAYKKDEELFSVLREKIEDLGVYVVIRGSFEKIPIDEFRGIAITDEYAPLILINGRDVPSARTFSMMHELAHLFLGDSSVYNKFPNNRDPKEVFCNKFAAEFMMPTEEVNRIFPNRIEETSASVIMDTLSLEAKKHNVSMMTLLYRLSDVGKISSAMVQQIENTIKRRVKEKRETQEGGPDRNKIDKLYLGDKVISTVLNARDAGTISDSSASALLNVKEYRFDRIRPK